MNTDLTDEIIYERLSSRKWPVALMYHERFGNCDIPISETAVVPFWQRPDDSERSALARFIACVNAAVAASRYVTGWLQFDLPEKYCEPVLKLFVRLLNTGSGVRFPNGKRIRFRRDRILFGICFGMLDHRVAHVVDLLTGYRPARGGGFARH